MDWIPNTGLSSSLPPVPSSKTQKNVLAATALLCVTSLLLAVLFTPRNLVSLERLSLAVGASSPIAHLPLSTRDTIANRCFLSQHETRHAPCRPLLGAVQKRFRTGPLPLATQVVVSDAYRFIYLKTRKVAGTSIFTGFFRAVLCAPRADHDDKLLDSFFGMKAFVPVRRNCSRKLLDPPLDYMRLPPKIDAIPLAKLHNYFVFAAARNPYERAVSSYEYCGLRRVGSFREFTQRPRAFGGKCGGTSTPKPYPDIANAHWDAQIQEMCDATGLHCMVDYVVDTANLVDMMDEVVDRINAGRNMSYPALPRFSDMTPKNNVRSSSNYSNHYARCPECRQQVFDHYKEDIVMFGYDFEFDEKR